MKRRTLRGLGDDTPDSIRVYVPRLASGLHALELMRTGKTYAGAPPSIPFASRRWMDGIQKPFADWAVRILGFNPIVHEDAGVDVIFPHMGPMMGPVAPGQEHARAEDVWAPFQRALNSARLATGTPAPNDPYAGQPREWERPVAAPGVPPVMQPQARRREWDWAAGVGMMLVAVAL